LLVGADTELPKVILMSEELYEVAFSGGILEGADIEQVKAKIGAMFKADAAKLSHLFSGKRVVIKKNIDQATANKYKAALTNAGADCEIKSLSAEASPVQVDTVQEKVATEAVKVATKSVSSDASTAPQTDPLGIRANDIADLNVNIAPVGSDMQDEIKEAVAPDLDLSGLDMAEPGSDLGEIKKGDAPPPPNTDGMKLVDS